MTKVFGIALVALVTLALATAACSGGDDRDDGVAPATAGVDSTPISTPLTYVTEGAQYEPTEYFQAADEIATGTLQALNSITDNLSGQTFTSESDEITANKDATQQTGQVLQIAYSHIQQLHPPPDAADENQALVQAMMDYADVVNRVSAALGSITTKAQFETVKQQFIAETSSKYNAYNDACQSLEDRGKALVAGYDIQCPNDR